MQKSILLVLASLCTVAMLGAIACGQPTPEPPPPTTVPRISPPPPQAAPTVPAQSNGAATGIGVTGGTPVDVALQDVGGSGEYAYGPSDMTFTAGETVTFSLTSETEFHTFEVDDLDIYVEVDAGDTVNYTFTFDSPGTYELICTPHSAQGMLGTITIN